MKTFICILTVVLAVSLTACESDNGADDTTSPTVGTEGITDSSTSSVHMEETKPDIESTEPEPEPTRGLAPFTRFKPIMRAKF